MSAQRDLGGRRAPTGLEREDELASDNPERDPHSFAMAEFIVSEAMGESLPDTVGPANVYCTNGLHGTLPLWGHDDSDRIAAGHHPSWYSQQSIEAGVTRETATIGRQTFGVTA